MSWDEGKEMEMVNRRKVSKPQDDSDEVGMLRNGEAKRMVQMEG